MANSLFILENPVDTAPTITASSAELAMPVENIQDQRRSLVWRSGFGLSSYVDISFNIKKLISIFACVDVNINATGSIKIQAFSDSARTTETYTATFAPTVYSQEQQKSLYGIGTYGTGTYSLNGTLNLGRNRNITIYEFPVPQFWQYWRITFEDGNTTYQQVSRIYLSTFDRFDVNLSYGWSARRIDRSIKKESLGGQIFTQTRDSRLQLQCQYDFLSTKERTRSLQIMESYAETYPLIFSISPENTDEGLTTSLYGTLSSPEASETNVALNNFSFGITEEL